MGSGSTGLRSPALAATHVRTDGALNTSKMFTPHLHNSPIHNVGCWRPLRKRNVTGACGTSGLIADAPRGPPSTPR